MRRREIGARVHTTAPPEVVFALVADGASYPRWSPIESFELEREGDPPPEGVGAIRVFRQGRITGRDLIVEIVPNRRFVYTALSGLPTRDYRGEVDLTPTADGGTDIHWHSSFFPKFPGTGFLMARGLGRFVAQCANGLAAAATSASSRPA